MKNAIASLFILTALTLSACTSGSNGSNGTNGYSNQNPAGGNIAAMPQACGTSIPAQYCTGYNPSAYGSYPYNSVYGTNGYGYYGTGGYYIPYTSSGYGCPSGYQPMYTGSYYGYSYGTYGTYANSGYTCVAVSYMSGYGYTPYYGTGYGATAQACDSLINSCPIGSRCVAFYGRRIGYCAAF